MTTLYHAVIVKEQRTKFDEKHPESISGIADSYTAQSDGTLIPDLTKRVTQLHSIGFAPPVGAPSANVLYLASWNTDEPFITVLTNKLTSPLTLHNVGWPQVTQAEWLASQQKGVV